MQKNLAICYALMTFLFGIAFFSSVALAAEDYPCKPEIDQHVRIWHTGVGPNISR